MLSSLDSLNTAIIQIFYVKVDNNNNSEGDDECVYSSALRICIKFGGKSRK